MLLLCEELGWELEPEAANAPASNEKPGAAKQRAIDGYARLHRALLTGIPTQIGQKGEKGLYEGSRGRRFQLFPGSPLAKQPPAWVLCATLLDTQKVWGLTCAKIEPDWAIAELEHLISRKHFDPHWARSQGRVIGHEQISLFGLVLAARRPISYGRLYPAEAHDIFVRQALVPGEIDTRANFVARNLATLEKAREEEAKLRRAGLVADEDWQARWYLDRIPADIHDNAGLEAWFRRLDAAARQSLEWSLADLLPAEGGDAERFPKVFPLGDARLALHYHFALGADDDGVTLDVPLHLLNALDPARLEWLVPGLVQDKAAALIRSLPKALRRNYVPAPDFARAFAEAYATPSADTLRGELARFLGRVTGSQLAATEFDESTLETHLRIRLRLLGGENEALAHSRDLAELKSRFGSRAEAAFAQRAGRELASDALEEFPRDPIPVQIEGEAGVPAFPALVDEGETVALRVFADAAQAAREHPRGVRKLLERALAERIRQARKQLPVAPKAALLYATLAGSGEDANDANARQQHLRDDLVSAALNALLEDGLEAIRDHAAFDARLADAGKRLFGEAMQRLTLAEAILGKVAGLRPKLESPLMGWGKANLDDVTAQLRGLVPPGFLRDTPGHALSHFPRYLDGIARRIERLLRDPSRDQARMLEIAPFVAALEKARRAPGFAAHPQWQALRWELEELRVSLFAQELGTAMPVSAKRLARKLEEFAKIDG